MPNPLVTAVIPVFNRAKLVVRAVESVFSQTWRPLELLLVDDGSTDSTGEVLEALSARHCSAASSDNGFSFRVLRLPENRGVSAARNAALRAARGAFIALLDSDDEWLPEKTTRQIAPLLACPGLFLNQTDEIWIRDGLRRNQNKRHWKEEGDLFEKSLDVCAISPSAVLMRRELFDLVGLFDESLPACEDFDLWLRIACRFPVGLVRERLVVKYGGHSDQLSATAGPLDLYRIQSVAKLLRSGELCAGQRAAAERSLKWRCRVYAQGCRKRGRNEEAREIDRFPGLVLSEIGDRGPR